MNTKNLLSVAILLIFLNQIYCKDWFKVSKNTVKEEKQPQLSKEDIDDILYGAKSEVNEYTWEEIEYLSQKNKNFFIVYYNDGCGHSNNAKKELDAQIEDKKINLENFFNKHDILVGKCNIESNPAIRKVFGGSAPLLKYYHEGAPIDIKVLKHDWKLYVEKIKEKWVNIVKSINSQKEFETLFEDGDVLVYTGYSHSPRYKMLVGISNEFKDVWEKIYPSIKLNYTYCPKDDVLKKYNMKLNELYFINKRTQKAYKFMKAWKEYRISAQILPMKE